MSRNGQTSSNGQGIQSPSGDTMQQLVLQALQSQGVGTGQGQSGRTSQLIGMVMVPPGSPSRGQQLLVQQSQGSGNPIVQVSTISATGGTIHHLGQSPTRGGPNRSLVTNPSQQQQSVSSYSMNVTQQQLQGLVSQLTQSQNTNVQSAQSSAMTVKPVKVNVNSPLQSPKKKRIKLEEKPPANEQIGKYRSLICEQKRIEIAKVKENYNDHLAELFYLQSGWNFIDYIQWRKKPTAQLIQVLQSGGLDSDDEDMTTELSINNEVKVLTTSGSTTPIGTPVAIATSLPPAVAAMQQGGSALSGGVDQKPPLPPVSHTSTLAEMMRSDTNATAHEDVKPTFSELLIASAAHQQKSVSSSPNSSIKGASAKPAISAVYENACGSQEAIVERAKQEAKVMQKVAELRKEGLWSARRLPKVQEPARNKAHWDYLLEEMQWLAADFAQERKWKKAGCRKIARMITKYHQEKHQKEIRAEKDEHMKIKRIASNMAKMVKEFWSNIEKVVEYKQHSRLEEKRKKALDLHLSFIVDQTEKYSSWLTEGFTAPGTSSVGSLSSVSGNEDEDFEPKSESDDESTIAAAEKDAGDVTGEIAALEKESEMPIEELLKSIPKEVFDKPADLISTSSSKSRKRKRDDDSEFDSDMEDSEDDEETVEKEEKIQGTVDHKAELDDLEEEGQMSIEELAKKYSGAYDSDFEAQLDEETEDETSTDEESEDETSEGDDGDDEHENQGDVGMEYLVKELEKEEPSHIEPAKAATSTEDATQAEGPAQITDFAAAAQSIQPTGYTLETTKVKTPIPFLLKHTMREYQVVGLDWLATMHERRLNGILADEMGLGKTIQTIALLAHLACEHGVWGPHLIVVPTSVMLNWEMEFKKWCPAFKILTYYGNQKERKQKRTGWTKTNAFHVCITSYKLVIQDHQAFRRKKWKYFILDEAQNIKNFKSQRWQTLLNFQSQRRLLLTGTPLQNSLMELWSLMHFLMPHVFQSHREFKEWFSNPLTGMIEGSHEYNENLIKRLHKVLRPFLLRRLKADVEKQMPKKYEHIVMCRLSKRQRFLYDDFMGQAKTKETLATGHFMSVINILMQLRKVCNHPNLFDPRPIQSPFQMAGINLLTPSLVLKALQEDPLECVDLRISPGCSLTGLEETTSAYSYLRLRKLRTSQKLIEEIDSQPDPPQRLRQIRGPLKLSVKAVQPTSVPVPQTMMSVEATPLSSLPGHTPTAVKVTHANGPMPNDASRYVTAVRLPLSSGIQNASKPVMRVSPSVQTPGVTATDLADVAVPKSPFHLHSLQQKKSNQRKEKLKHIYELNERNCEARPIYGKDLLQCVNVMDDTVNEADWRSIGFLHCHQALSPRKHMNHPSMFWRQTKGLRDILHTPEEYLLDLKDIIERFVFTVPPVCAPRIQMHASHPPPSWLNQQRMLEWTLHNELAPKAKPLHPISTRSLVQFPEARLIQYDCGKLQTLDTLLRRLKSGQHRVLIFTQMTKMLDILESFLNFHGHRYLRLDGTTRVEQRQMLMDRFNQDKRIFVFILSTRSGGIGVNLTGADTVIFYDSDWNPTMDAQAQDRCHRIGQTRDVHIYRLISEMTIEENILKKANQKRMLGNMAIEGGNFTTEFFKEQSLTDLFNEPSGLEKFVKQKQALEEQAAKLKAEGTDEKLTPEQIEQALQAAEDEADVQAAKQVQAEQKAECAEFDETIPWDEQEAAQAAQRDQELSRVEQELLMLEKELTPIEKFAVTFLEDQMAPVNVEELEKAEEEVTIAKEEWELTRLQALRDEEERRLELEEDEMLYTYSRQSDAPDSQVKKKKGKKGKKSGVGVELGGLPGLEGYVYLNASALDIVADKGQKRGRVKNHIIELPPEMPVEYEEPELNGYEKEEVADYYEEEEESVDMEFDEELKPPQNLMKGRSNIGTIDSVSKLSVKKSKLEEPVLNGDLNVNNDVTVKKKVIKARKVSPKKCKSVPMVNEIAHKSLSPSSIPQPWSNPNLVIRTRRASAKEGSSGEEMPSPPREISNAIPFIPAVVGGPMPAQQRAPKTMPERQSLFSAMQQGIDTGELDILSVNEQKPTSTITGPTPILSKFILPTVAPSTNCVITTSNKANVSQTISLASLANLNPALRNALAKISKPGQLLNLSGLGGQVIVSRAHSKSAHGNSEQVTIQNHPPDNKTVPTKNPVPILEKMALALQQQKALKEQQAVLAAKAATPSNPTQLLKNVIAARAGGTSAPQNAQPSTSHIQVQQVQQQRIVRATSGGQPLQLIPQQIIRVPGSPHHFIQLKAANPQQLVQIRQVVSSGGVVRQVVSSQMAPLVSQVRPRATTATFVSRPTFATVVNRPVGSTVVGRAPTAVINRPQTIVNRPGTFIRAQNDSLSRPTALLNRPIGTVVSRPTLVSRGPSSGTVMARPPGQVVIARSITSGATVQQIQNATYLRPGTSIVLTKPAQGGTTFQLARPRLATSGTLNLQGARPITNVTFSQGQVIRPQVQGSPSSILIKSVSGQSQTLAGARIIQSPHIVQGQIVQQVQKMSNDASGQ